MSKNPAKTVLFVDDEPHILSSLRRLMHEEGWQILTAIDGLKGLELLQKHDVDLVVSDMVMSKMDGTQFLKQVKEKHPDTTRIILTGYPKSNAVTRAFAEADIFQIIPKPWDDEELKEIIRNALQQSDNQEEESPELRQLINKMDALPALPHIFVELKQILQDADHSSTEAVAEVIGQEPTVAAKILQVANTAYFGQRRNVETINRAVVLLGLEMIEDLVLSASVFQSFAAEDIEGLSHDDLWRHSMGCSLAARVIEQRRSPDRERLEKITLAGILHDLGKLIFIQAMRDQYAEVVRKARDTCAPIADIEREILGVDHAVMGGYLGNWWNLPDSVVDAIRWHHEPGDSQEDPPFISTIHLADVMVHRVGIGASGSGSAPEVHPLASDFLGLDEEDLQAIETEIKEQSENQGTLS